MGRPVLYVDERAGRHGTPFRLLKFRSMRELRAGEKIPDNDADRVTRIGRFTRATSIDELPSLLNVIRGQMSLVGPRPLPVRYTDRLSPQHRRRLEVRPGITGLAQCAGRNSLSWDDRFDLDVRYVDERTLVGDLRLMAKTLAPVLLRRNVGHGEQLTMPEFGLDPQPEHQHGGDGGTH